MKRFTHALALSLLVLGVSGLADASNVCNWSTTAGDDYELVVPFPMRDTLMDSVALTIFNPGTNTGTYTFTFEKHSNTGPTPCGGSGASAAVSTSCGIPLPLGPGAFQTVFVGTPQPTGNELYALRLHYVGPVPPLVQAEITYLQGPNQIRADMQLSRRGCR